MFGFGKKKLDDRMLGMISIELPMFLRWVEDNSHRMLEPHEVKGDIKWVEEFRKKSGFYTNIASFFNSIGIPVPE